MLAVVFELDGACLAWRKLGEVAAPGQIRKGLYRAMHLRMFGQVLALVKLRNFAITIPVSLPSGA